MILDLILRLAKLLRLLMRSVLRLKLLLRLVLLIHACESEENSSQIGSSTDSLTRMLGKKHPGYVRGMGLGPCPSQVLGLTTHQMGGISLSSTNEVALVEEVKDLREELRTNNERMHTLEAQMTQMASVLRSVASHIPTDLSNIIGSQFPDQASGEGSPAGGARRSSSASHELRSHQ